MSIYQFVPSPSFGVGDHEFVYWEKGFSDEELDFLISYCETLEKCEASVGGSGNQPAPDQIRKSNVSWIDLNQSSDWIYSRLSEIARKLNGQFYQYDLFGFCEHLQYTVYDSKNEGHYTWHQDSYGSDSLPPRKMSLVMQLSDPSEYEGGDFELLTKSEPTVVKKQKGTVIMFPSHVLHRVTPVLSGVRKTLVAWICGPKLR